MVPLSWCLRTTRMDYLLNLIHSLVKEQLTSLRRRGLSSVRRLPPQLIMASVPPNAGEFTDPSERSVD
jgi:hypothetical protein